MQELIYDATVEPIILKRWPDAEIVDASDDIHRGRFQVDLDVEEDEFYPFAIKEGFAEVCLCFQIMARRKEDHPKIYEWIEKAKTAIAEAEKEE